ncbi:MAG TPA: hypothetical protein DEQ40_00355 [Oxalobacteraceae bacterium]|jgi:hypothetical protein|nr:hypothetical protein [Oxalobacteraceae bacterium]
MTASLNARLGKTIQRIAAAAAPAKLVPPPVPAVPVPVWSDGLLPLHALTFQPAIPPAKLLGVPGKMRWLDLRDLYIDPSYQRAVLTSGRKNIGRIVAGFNWALFSPLVVCRRENASDGRERYAIIDGQHRAIGARTHGGIRELPCLVIHGGPEMEAKAFALINGQVTAILPTYIHAARVLAKEPDALELDRVCQASGVRILKYGNGAAFMKPGDTLAIGTLEKALARYGSDTLITALQCVTETGNGNPGLLNISVINGLCYVLDNNRKARDAGERLFNAIEAYGGIAIMHHRAGVAKAANRGTMTANFIVEVRKTLAGAKLESSK